MPFNEILESSRTWKIFIMSSISLFEIISAVVPEPCIFFWIPASIADAAAFPNGAKNVFGYETALFINGTGILLNNELKKPSGWIILDICILDNFISAEKLFSNAFLNLAR